MGGWFRAHVKTGQRTGERSTTSWKGILSTLTKNAEHLKKNKSPPSQLLALMNTKHRNRRDEQEVALQAWKRLKNVIWLWHKEGNKESGFQVCWTGLGIPAFKDHTWSWICCMTQRRHTQAYLTALQSLKPSRVGNKQRSGKDACWEALTVYLGWCAWTVRQLMYKFHRPSLGLLQAGHQVERALHPQQ